MKKAAGFDFKLAALFLAIVSILLPGLAEPVRNGNELALSYATNSAFGKNAVSKSAVGVFHTFRYLKITEIKLDTPHSGAATLMAVEPSSALAVKMVITAPLSLEKARNLQPGDCIAGKGRVKSLGAEGKDLLVLDPAIINHKDREAPKLSQELLREVDSDAH